jgi:hypothetical protein
MHLITQCEFKCLITSYELNEVESRQMDLCYSLLIFDFYLYMYIGVWGEPTVHHVQALAHVQHGSFVMMALFIVGLWAQMGLLVHRSYWASTVHSVIKYVM